jgi:hypothetical protein
MMRIVADGVATPAHPGRDGRGVASKVFLDQLHSHYQSAFLVMRLHCLRPCSCGLSCDCAVGPIPGVDECEFQWGRRSATLRY